MPNAALGKMPPTTPIFLANPNWGQSIIFQAIGAAQGDGKITSTAERLPFKSLILFRLLFLSADRAGHYVACGS